MKHLTLFVLFGAVLSAQAADTVDSHVLAANALNAATPTALINLCEHADSKRLPIAAAGLASP